MPKKAHTEEQIVAALQRVESGEKVARSAGLGHQPGNVLRLEEALCRPGGQRRIGHLLPGDGGAVEPGGPDCKSCCQYPNKQVLSSYKSRSLLVRETPTLCGLRTIETQPNVSVPSVRKPDSLRPETPETRACRLRVIPRPTQAPGTPRSRVKRACLGYFFQEIRSGGTFPLAAGCSSA
jgi:hypothetical protein